MKEGGGGKSVRELVGNSVRKGVRADGLIGWSVVQLFFVFSFNEVVLSMLARTKNFYGLLRIKHLIKTR